MNGFVDLHTHTAHSREADNFLPERLRSIAQAKSKMSDLKMVGVVDHDTLNHLEPMYRAKEQFTEEELPIILPGIEISCAFEFVGKQIQTHLLGYFPNLIEMDREMLSAVDAIMGPVMNRVLTGKLKKNVDIRIDYFVRNGIIPTSYDVQQLKERMLQRYEDDCTFVEVTESKKGDIINWQVPSSDKLIIDILLEDGILFSAKEGKLYVDRKSAGKARELAAVLSAKEGISAGEAQDKAERLQGSCHGSYGDDYEKISTQEAIMLVLKAGGIPILAHPMVTIAKFPGGADSFFEFCKSTLLPSGMMGMETFYPGQGEFVSKIIGFCQENDLFITGGSDDHQDGRNHIGEEGSRCPIEYIKAMLPYLF